MEYIVELPFVTPLSLNDRMDRHERSRLTKKWRESTGWAARAARVPRLGQATICLHYTPRDNRERDPLNLVASLKAAEDGLVDVKVINADHRKVHTPVMPIITDGGPPRKAGNRLWLVITPGGGPGSS